VKGIRNSQHPATQQTVLCRKRLWLGNTKDKRRDVLVGGQDYAAPDPGIGEKKLRGLLAKMAGKAASEY